VLSDLNAVVADGDPLVGVNSQTVNVSGGQGSANLGTFALGAYDVVCDIDADGMYYAGTDLVARARRFHACFTIQDANSGNDIIGQVCSDRHGNYRDVFDPNATDPAIRDVFAWIFVTRAVVGPAPRSAYASTWSTTKRPGPTETHSWM